MARSRRKGRRPRRTGTPPAAGAASEPRDQIGKARRRTARGEPPRALWGSFPLSELVVLAALAFLVTGFVLGGRQGAILIGAGLVAGSLAGLELALREHVAGYRSHTLVLSAAAGLATFIPLLLLAPDGTPVAAIAVAGVAVACLAAYGLTAAFRRASGGLSFRIARPRR